MTTPPRPGGYLGLVLILAAGMLALGTMLAVGRRAPTPARPRAARAGARSHAAVPPIPPAAPEPTIRADLTPDQARLDNAAVPFAPGRVAPAPPFRYAASPAAHAAAEACLAAAVLYEAGDDAPGEQAVAQVVLNRLRHPAFPKSVCGVVFQGSERSTGCQFTFTCDGALARRPRPDAWERARAIAARALTGFVVRGVGAATHYHADYVVPYWRSGLEKIAQVHAHIFYRWPGRWGQPAVLAGGPQDAERVDPRIAALAGIVPDTPGLADAPADGAVGGTAAGDEAPPAPRAALTIEGVPRSALKGSVVRLADAAAAQYVLQLDPAAYPGGWAIVGYTICGARRDCLVMGWTSEAETPRALPVPPSANRTMAFMYRKSSVLDLVQPYWDCRRFPRADHAQCLAGSQP